MRVLSTIMQMSLQHRLNANGAAKTPAVTDGELPPSRCQGSPIKLSVLSTSSGAVVTATTAPESLLCPQRDGGKDDVKRQQTLQSRTRALNPVPQHPTRRRPTQQTISAESNHGADKIRTKNGLTRTHLSLSAKRTPYKIGAARGDHVTAADQWDRRLHVLLGFSPSGRRRTTGMFSKSTMNVTQL